MSDEQEQVEQTEEVGEVGDAFCKALTILSDNKNGDACKTAWERGAKKEIDQDTLNEYLEDTYGKGLPHKTKEIMLALLESGQMNEK